MRNVISVIIGQRQKCYEVLFQFPVPEYFSLSKLVLDQMHASKTQLYVVCNVPLPVQICVLISRQLAQLTVSPETPF